MEFYLGKHKKSRDFILKVDGVYYIMLEWDFPNEKIIKFEEYWVAKRPTGCWRRVEYPEILLTHPHEVVRDIARNYLEGEEDWIKMFIEIVNDAEYRFQNEHRLKFSRNYEDVT